MEEENEAEYEHEGGGRDGAGGRIYYSMEDKNEVEYEDEVVAGGVSVMRTRTRTWTRMRMRMRMRMRR